MMKKAITVGATALVLSSALSGVAAAQSEEPDAATAETDDGNEGLGLWGLAGLAGLAGLIKRKSHDTDDQRTGTSAGARR